MKTKFIGYGGAFDTHLTNSSALVEHNGRRTLIDCGQTVFAKLKNTGIIQEVDEVLVSHLHDDHVGSLSAFAIYFSKVLQKGPLPVYAATEEFSREIREFLSYSLIRVEEYADIRVLEKTGPIQVFDTFGMHVSEMQTWGFHFREGEENMCYSGDLGNPNFLFEQISERGIERPLIFHEISFNNVSGAHSYYKDLEKWLRHYPLYGYHCDPALNPSDNPIPLVAHQPDFLLQTTNPMA